MSTPEEVYKAALSRLIADPNVTPKAKMRRLNALNKAEMTRIIKKTQEERLKQKKEERWKRSPAGALAALEKSLETQALQSGREDRPCPG